MCVLTCNVNPKLPLLGGWTARSLYLVVGCSHFAQQLKSIVPCILYDGTGKNGSSIAVRHVVKCSSLRCLRHCWDTLFASLLGYVVVSLLRSIVVSLLGSVVVSLLRYVVVSLLGSVVVSLLGYVALVVVRTCSSKAY